jgi:DNA-directed RNA polymerase subunit RPC12/RpoP
MKGAPNMVLQHKCPDCGSDMIFDTTSGMLACPSCGHKDNIEHYPNTEYSSDTNNDIDKNFGNFKDFQASTNSNTYSENEAAQYKCNNCGAVLITDTDTSATTCSFCGSPVVLGDRLSGDLAPDKVIPFTISKDQAQVAFKKWCRKGLLTPKGFMTADRIKNITGMYIPFWLFNLNGRGEASATCTQVRTYERGEYIYTETKYYDVYRKVDLNYANIPVDASEKMSDKLMDKLEPFHYSDLKNFNTPYLAGYIAEKYNFTDKDLLPRVKARAEQYVDSYIRSTINGYSTTTFTEKHVDIKSRNADYSLLPIWMICYDYKQTEHIFAMNGQTGKIVGTPPLSKRKMASWFAGISAASFLVFTMIAFIAGRI